MRRKSLVVFLLLLAALISCTISFAAEKEKEQQENDAVYKHVASFGERKSLRIALCHLDVSQGPQEKIFKNRKSNPHCREPWSKLDCYAGNSFAGILFLCDRSETEGKIETQPSDAMRPLLNASSRYGAYLFLGAGDYDKQAECYRNSCLIFGPDGKPVGRHNKMSAHVGFGAEVWSTNDNKLNPVVCSGVATGVLVCSDIWFLNYPRVLADKGAQIIVDIAAWPPAKETGNPLPSWELASQRTGLPVVVCNQTGNPRWMDMTPGQSAVVENGKAKLLHSGEEAVLLFDWNPGTGKVVSDTFDILTISN